MKRFLIITLPEYENAVQEQLRKIGLHDLIQPRNPHFERLKLRGDERVNYGVLSFRLSDACLNVTERETFDTEDFVPSMSELRELAVDLEKTIDIIVGELEDRQKRLEKARLSLEEAKTKLIEIRSKLRILRALKPEELKKCIAVGVIKVTKVAELGFTQRPRLEEHLLRYKDLSYKLVEIWLEEQFLFVFGPEERRSWVEALLLVFDVKDIFDVLNVRDILLALDPRKREESLKGYEDEISALQKYVESEGEVQHIKSEIAPLLAKATFVQRFLNVILDDKAPVLKTKAISVMIGQIPKAKASELRSLTDDLEKKTQGSLHVQFEDSNSLKSELKI